MDQTESLLGNLSLSIYYVPRCIQHTLVKFNRTYQEIMVSCKLPKTKTYFKIVTISNKLMLPAEQTLW